MLIKRKREQHHFGDDWKKVLELRHGSSFRESNAAQSFYVMACIEMDNANVDCWDKLEGT